MRTFLMFAALLCVMLVPAMAAEAPGATEKRITTLENTTAGMREDLGNVSVDLTTTRKGLTSEAKAREDLDARLAKLAQALDNEIAARNASDKVIAELNNDLSDQKAALVNANLKIAALQADLDKSKADQATAVAALAKALDKNASKDKKDQTITYVMGLLLGAGVAFSK